jgi:hypothetical protein
MVRTLRTIVIATTATSSNKRLFDRGVLSLTDWSVAAADRLMVSFRRSRKEVSSHPSGRSFIPMPPARVAADAVRCRGVTSEAPFDRWASSRRRLHHAALSCRVGETSSSSSEQFVVISDAGTQRPVRRQSSGPSLRQAIWRWGAGIGNVHVPQRSRNMIASSLVGRARVLSDASLPREEFTAGFQTSVEAGIRDYGVEAMGGLKTPRPGRRNAQGAEEQPRHGAR